MASSPANPCAIKGASQRDSRHRPERRVVTPDELWALQRRHVDLVAGTVRVEKSLARPGKGGGPSSATKSRAELRTIPLPAAAVDVLAEHMTRFTPRGRDALVFGTSTGRPLTGGSRTTVFGRARRAIGRDDLTWHDLRHFTMTLVALTGASLPKLMQRAGRSTPRAALHCKHAADDDAQRRIAERLGALTPHDRRRGLHRDLRGP